MKLISKMVKAAYLQFVVPLLGPSFLRQSESFRPTSLRVKTQLSETANAYVDSSGRPVRKHLYIPFECKEKAKKLGARWDMDTKGWYNPDPIKYTELDQWAAAIYLAVPFDENAEAKALGAKWDSAKKQWFNPKPSIDSPLNRWKINDEEFDLVGEDRSFGGDLLFVDLVPKSCWFTNVRSCVHPKEWDRLRRKVYSRAGNCCECCGSNEDGLEAHERWHYDGEKGVQKLMRLVALCCNCHQATHIGYAEIQGKYEEASAHLKEVRGFNDSEVDNHISDAFKLYIERSQRDWELDLTLLTSNGIETYRKPRKEERSKIVTMKLEMEKHNEDRKF